MSTFTYQFDTAVYKGSTSLDTRLFIDGKFVDPVAQTEGIEIFNPATGKLITKISAASAEDVDVAVKAATKAYKESWGLKVPPEERARLINKLADLCEQHIEEFAALEALNLGAPFLSGKTRGVPVMISMFRYFAGWAGKITGDTTESNADKFTYTRREPYGVVAQILPWNANFFGYGTKLGPALATGNTIVLKPSEVNPLSSFLLAKLVVEAGFPPGVVNIVNGYGSVVGQRLAEHPKIWKIAFTGSTVVGRKIQEASARTNLKVVSLELGGKSPNIIFDDAELDQAIKWSTIGFCGNTGQACVAGTRIFVQEGIYDKFVEGLKGAADYWKSVTGDPFEESTMMGPIVSKNQFERVLSYIESGKSEGATVHAGGARESKDGYFVQPTVFTDTTPDMKIVKEEIFGPVAAIVKFKTEEEVIEWANDTDYGLACGVFTQNVNRAHRVSNALEAGIAWVNCYMTLENSMPFGGYKQSGIGRELGQVSLEQYTRVKAVQVNIGQRL